MRIAAVCALALAGLLSACASTTETADTGYTSTVAAEAPPPPPPPPAATYQAPPPSYVPPADTTRAGERG
jgi:hypothetical protein